MKRGLIFGVLVILLGLIITPIAAMAQDTDGLTDAFETSYSPTDFTCMAGDGCASVPNCPVLAYGGHNYLFCPTPSLTWPEARDMCRAYGGDLVAMDDTAENDWVLNNYTNNYAWIGYNDLDVEDVFE